MNAPKVVVHEVQRNCVRMVLDFLENALVSRVNRRHDMRSVRFDRRRSSSRCDPNQDRQSFWFRGECKLARTVLPISVALRFVAAVHLDERGLVHIGAERIDRICIDYIVVRGELYAVRETRVQIGREGFRSLRTARADHSRAYELTISVQCRPSPDVANAE